MMNAKPVAKYSVGDSVIADGDCATITEVILPADSEMFSGAISYAVEWATDEWGTFTEDELEGVEE
jgi:hypothetical protein